MLLPTAPCTGYRECFRCRAGDARRSNNRSLYHAVHSNWGAGRGCASRLRALENGCVSVDLTYEPVGLTATVQNINQILAICPPTESICASESVAKGMEVTDGRRRCS